MSALTIERTDGIATVTFDNPSQRNALDLAVANELVDAAATLGSDPDVRCIVLTHTGDFYGTGADLTRLDGDAGDEPDIRKLAGRLHEAIVQFHQAPTPVLGGIDGVAAGASFGLALVPDLLVLSEDARLEFAYPRIGLTGDGGSTFFLPRLVGLRTAKEIVLLDEPITPERAVDLGLATEAVPTEAFEERLDDLATQLAEGPTAALGEASRLLTESFDRGIEAQLAAETDTIGRATRTDDYERGHAAFFGDDDPEFTGQ
ncbi:Enoyl-CoA hydratase [Halovenus aranensis]|uniref:Enoyl-CoA hydratase n=1 Tax=Halovenus aranensis TaxID=890420 RepID=A0A1G8VRF5_9EURY|nr:enoyl-CoA hydratase/isomerase family protein [Halovenus aranensis]SDJ68467.1 Enoyl-CoA hydratase [Halovenus aranensis]